MTKLGKQTWDFHSNPVYVASTGTISGHLEGQGPLGNTFDARLENDRIDGDTWEHSEQKMFAQAAQIALKKSDFTAHQLDAMIGADLNAQLSSFYLGLRGFSIPALGVYSACASICEGLAIGSLLIHSGHAERALVGTSSHTSTAEKQFRYPTEYGTQKPATAQRTVTGAGASILTNTASTIEITHATIGKVNDFGVSSPWEMGAAMAPAAADTLTAHLKDTQRSWSDYDCIATGDLGRIGHAILRDLLLERHQADNLSNLTDCGMLIYDENQPEVFSGGSGGACCTIVTFGHLFDCLLKGTYKRILVSATGALLSSVTAQQGDSIPCVSHAIAFERKDVV